MSFTKQLRSWFFRNNAPLNIEGKKVNFQDNQRPDQDAFEKLTASALFFTEAEDRAKINTGAAFASEVGTVAITSDTKAKANTSGFEADRTLVVHAGQLPTPDVSSQVIDDFTGAALDITPDGTTTRNNNIFTLSATFSAWLLSRLVPGGGTVGQVLSKVSGTDYDLTWVTPTAIPASSSIIVKEEGATVGTTTSTIDFVGDGVTATDAGGNETTVTIPRLIVQDTDVTVGTTTATLNFEGTAVASTVDEGSGKTTVTINQAAASTPSYSWANLATSVINLTFDSGTTAGTYTPTVTSATIKYIKIDKLVVLNYTFTVYGTRNEGALPFGVSAVVAVGIDVSSIGTLTSSAETGFMAFKGSGTTFEPAAGNYQSPYCVTNLGSNEIRMSSKIAHALLNTSTRTYTGSISFSIS